MTSQVTNYIQMLHGKQFKVLISEIKKLLPKHDHYHNFDCYCCLYAIVLKQIKKK